MKTATIDHKWNHHGKSSLMRDMSMNPNNYKKNRGEHKFTPKAIDQLDE
jgi:hypothetical protein